MFVGPGNASCVCAEGWTGDGQVCVEINNCQLDTRGGCSPNADCIHRGPGDVSPSQSFTNDFETSKSLIIPFYFHS